jgi:hypothetical protein
VLPRISVVVPVFNAAAFLESALQSILTQDYCNREVIVVDGGSTDGSVDIIRKHASNLHWWCSEPDRGQYHAVNKGFSHATGEIMCWLNADDCYFDWTLTAVGKIFASIGGVEWLTTLFPALMNPGGELVSVSRSDGYGRGPFFRGVFMKSGLPHQRGYIMQEGTFWRRSLWEKAGGAMDIRWDLAGDFELWSRFFKHAELYGVKLPLAKFRCLPAQRSRQHADEYIEQAMTVLATAGGRMPSKLSAWFWSLAPGRLWPLSVCPRLGFLHQAPQICWNWKQSTWEVRRRWMA